MQVIKNSALALLSFVFFTGCSFSGFNTYTDNNENLIINKERIFISSAKKRINPNSCVDFSYTVNDENSIYGKIFLESIDLSQNCRWNGYPRGFLQSSMKKYLKPQSMELLEKIDVEGYEFTTFKVNDKFYVSLIYKYFGSDEKFFIDFDGILSETLLKKFKANYVSKYKSLPRYKASYNASLVRDNFIESYFSPESRVFMD